jgi:hypothetical protein
MPNNPRPQKNNSRVLLWIFRSEQYKARCSNVLSKATEKELGLLDDDDDEEALTGRRQEEVARADFALFARRHFTVRFRPSSDRVLIRGPQKKDRQHGYDHGTVVSCSVVTVDMDA